MRLSVAEVRNLHPTCRPDRLLTTAGLARGVQRGVRKCPVSGRGVQKCPPAALRNQP